MSLLMNMFLLMIAETFNVVGVGSVGIGTAGTASLTIKYSENVPTKLYYALEKVDTSALQIKM